MADTKISALPAATTPLAGTEVLPIVQSGATDKVSVANLTAGRRISTAGMDANIGGSAHGVKITGITGGNQDFWAFRNGSAVIQEGPNITLQSATGTTYASTIQMGPTGDTLFFMYNGSSWNQRFAMTTAGNLAISTSGQGIDFSATPGTGTSELLSDYEEGTWTPALNGSTPGTVTATVSGTYTKIGRTVFCTFSIVQTSAGAGTGDTIISGLPYAISSQAAGSIGSVQNLKANVVRIQPYGSSGSSFYLFGMAAAAASDSAALAYNTYIQNNTQLYGTFSYITA